jgi:hypothetical protein
MHPYDERGGERFGRYCGYIRKYHGPILEIGNRHGAG